MTKSKALKIMLQIVEECKKHETESNSCRGCVFGCDSRCLVSDGNGLPTDWLINDKIYGWMEGATK